MPRRLASRRSRVVSSAAMTGAAASSAVNRPDASSRRPMGDAARISEPAAGSRVSPVGSLGISSLPRILFPSLRPGFHPVRYASMAATEAGVPATETAGETTALRDRLAVPRTLIFDETYYAKDAYSLLKFGVERNPVHNANALIQSGSTHIFASGAEYVVMPPLGKWIIAGGEWLFGLNSFGWRFSAAVFGSLAILLISRITRRMTRSTLLGCIAGLLMSLDGLEFVMSRTGLLDIFLMFFVLASFGCLVIDRAVSRARLARTVAARGTSGGGPGIGIHWWRVAAGFFIGCACACKWDAIWYIIAFAALAVAWDVGARRAAGITHFWRGALVRDAKWLPLTFGVLPLAVYIVSWTGWFASPDGYDRNYAATVGVHTPVLSALYSLYEYHVAMLQFGVGLSVRHPYESQPWDWLVLSRQ